MFNDAWPVHTFYGAIELGSEDGSNGYNTIQHSAIGQETARALTSNDDETTPYERARATACVLAVI